MDFAREMCERFLGFYGVIHLFNAIKAARETNRQKAMRSSFLVGKGPGDRSLSRNAQKHETTQQNKPGFARNSGFWFLRKTKRASVAGRSLKAENK